MRINLCWYAGKYNSVDTSSGWFESGQKILITGTIYQIDGKTPAPNMILYYWQTDNIGYYSNNKNLHKDAIRHGHIRGWVKTDRNGNYSIFTIKPAPYPNGNIPAHIHPVIKESTITNGYYIDDFVFDDDILLTGALRKAMENRGGSGVLRLLVKDDLLIAERNIILGLNIPNYPILQKSEIQSGKNIGEDIVSFTPLSCLGTRQRLKSMSNL